MQSSTMMAFSPPLETLPTDCFNHICVHLEVGYLANLAACSKSMASLCGDANGELWNLLLCQRLWAVDPATVLQLNTTADQVEWKEQYQTLVKAERNRQEYLDHLQNVDLQGWLERHFIGQLAPHYNGWEARYWTWNSSQNSFSAWESDSRMNCFATFPLSRMSEVRRVSREEQTNVVAIDRYTAQKDTRNPVTETKPFCFTITHTSLNLLFSCETEEQLQQWVDKINVTLHPLKFGGKTYKAPAQYLLQKKQPNIL